MDAPTVDGEWTRHLGTAMPWCRCPVVGQQLRRVVDILASDTASASAAPPAFRHLVEQPGKCVRAALVLLGARFGRAESDDAIALAVGIELIHIATLYHDDVIDDAPLRRGTATASRRWGNVIAVYAGGYHMSRAIDLFAGAGGEISRLASQAVERLWTGQMEEMEGSGNPELPISRYLRIVANKTGPLFELSCRLGARVGGLAREDECALARFGRKVGVAFQIADDLSDLLAGVSRLGKEPGIDLRHGVFSLPIIDCVRRRTPDAEELRWLLTRPGPPSVEKVRAILRRSDSIDFTRGVIAAYLESAERALMRLARGQTYDSLIAFTRSIGASVVGLG